MASKEERDILANDVLPTIGKNADRMTEEKICGFLSMRGRNYNHGLMIVGRAVNGWEPYINPRDLNTLDATRKYADRIFEKASGVDHADSGSNDPMSWVTKCWGKQPDQQYNAKKSAFWRTVHKVACRLAVLDTNFDSWPSHLVWSNLYKVAPKAGNPNRALRELQFKGCIDILRLELNAYNPRWLLLLTGEDWARPFLEQLYLTTYNTPQYNLVQAIGHSSYASTPVKIVVAVHPQGKSGERWTGEVLSAFEELSHGQQ